MASDLPADLKAVLARLSAGVSREALAARAQRMSQTYRGGGSSAGISDRTDALAYALVRMPATFAAVGAALDAACEAIPDFAPRSLLDVGAGPGTASWAAAERFADLEAATLLDANGTLRQLALDIAADIHRPFALDYVLSSARAGLDAQPKSDLVIASYMLGELSGSDAASAVDPLWHKTGSLLLIVEPGTPAGYQTILTARTRLIAGGAHIAAPCPHRAPCPLAAPDWCHFSERLARSRDHKRIKGGEVPFEDEKFSYLAVVRSPLAQSAARVLDSPDVGKAAITAKLCEPDGESRIVAIPRRDRAAYAAARRWRWGDAVVPGAQNV